MAKEAIRLIKNTRRRVSHQILPRNNEIKYGQTEGKWYLHPFNVCQLTCLQRRPLVAFEIARSESHKNNRSHV